MRTTINIDDDLMRDRVNGLLDLMACDVLQRLSTDRDALKVLKERLPHFVEPEFRASRTAVTPMSANSRSPATMPTP